jgi:hypothetical protein
VSAGVQTVLSSQCALPNPALVDQGAELRPATRRVSSLRSGPRRSSWPFQRPPRVISLSPVWAAANQVAMKVSPPLTTSAAMFGSVITRILMTALLMSTPAGVGVLRSARCS